MYRIVEHNPRHADPYYNVQKRVFFLWVTIDQYNGSLGQAREWLEEHRRTPKHVTVYQED